MSVVAWLRLVGLFTRGDGRQEPSLLVQLLLEGVVTEVVEGRRVARMSTF